MSTENYLPTAQPLLLLIMSSQAALPGNSMLLTRGTVNLKMYMTTKILPAADSLVYDQSIAMAKGKQNVFVHDFEEVPMIFDNGFPYIKRETVTTDSIAWVKFYNFLYDTVDVPTTKIIQYQYVDTRTSALVNIGTPVAFGEATDWVQVTVVKSVVVSQGSRSI